MLIHETGGVKFVNLSNFLTFEHEKAPKFGILLRFGVVGTPEFIRIHRMFFIIGFRGFIGVFPDSLVYQGLSYGDKNPFNP